MELDLFRSLVETESEAVAQSIQTAVSLRVLPGNNSVTCVSSCYLLQERGESPCFLLFSSIFSLTLC